MENLHLTLPWNLSAGLGYGFTKAEANFDTPSSSGNSDSTGSNYILDLTHRLYDSLVTRYTFRLQDASSTVGSSNATSNVLSVNYAKNIPAAGYTQGSVMPKWTAHSKVHWTSALKAMQWISLFPVLFPVLSLKVTLG